MGGDGAARRTVNLLHYRYAYKLDGKYIRISIILPMTKTKSRNALRGRGGGRRRTRNRYT